MPEIRTVQDLIPGANSLITEMPCTACNELLMSKTEICKGGGRYHLNETNYPAIYLEIMDSIIEPPRSKKRFAESTELTKLEIVLIEMRPNLNPIYRSVLYNIAHIYGGTEAAFTIFCHADAFSQVNEIIRDNWKNVRVLTTSQSGTTFRIPDYNILLTNPEFWALFKSRFVLITQIDTVIFRQLDDWMFDYAMIGAPWGDWVPRTAGKPRVGNGGYTLRNVTTMKSVVRTHNYSIEYPAANWPEDVWWHDKLQNLPTESKALEFSAENFALDDFIPTGAHQMEILAPMRTMGKAFRLLQQYGRCI